MYRIIKKGMLAINKLSVSTKATEEEKDGNRNIGQETKRYFPEDGMTRY